jgi:bifunctional DNA-binding transcriptional regulator/antitoxin component of YhaV-PrlF toxin-antitoxin module
MIAPSFYTTCIEDEEGNLILEFPDEFLEALGWGEGTVLNFTIVNERIVIQKAESNPGSSDDEGSGKDSKSAGGKSKTKGGDKTKKSKRKS